MRFTGLLTALLLPCLLRADEAEKPLAVSLISETRSIAPGKPFLLGIHLIHPPGSHTYWKNPGIVGLATSVEWDLPPGFRAGEIQWPAPQVVKMAGHDAQGYEGETLLLIPLTPPEKLTEASVQITARISWMCCGKTCHPAMNVPFSITLPIGNAESDPATLPLFEKTKRFLPGPPNGWKQISVKREGGKILLTLDRGKGQRDPFWSENTPIRFFTADGQVDSDQKQETRTSADGITVMTLIPSETGPDRPGSLPGILEIPTGKSADFVEINPAY